MDYRDDELFTLEEIAPKVKLTVATLRRYARQGRIDAVKFGGEWRVSRDAFERFKRKPGK